MKYVLLLLEMFYSYPVTQRNRWFTILRTFESPIGSDVSIENQQTNREFKTQV